MHRALTMSCLSSALRPEDWNIVKVYKVPLGVRSLPEYLCGLSIDSLARIDAGAYFDA